MSDQIDKMKEDFEPDSAQVRDIALFAVVVNAKIGSAESLGGGFPFESLYVMYRAFDYLAESYLVLPYPDGKTTAGDDFRDEENEIVTAEERAKSVDHAHSMLCLAYIHAALLLGNYYIERYKALSEKFRSVDMSSYDGDLTGPMHALRASTLEFEQSVSRFMRSFFEMCETFDDQCVWMIESKRSDRMSLLEDFDSWVAVCEKRYDAFCDAVPLMEEETSRQDRFVERAGQLADLAGDVMATVDMFRSDTV